MTSKKNIYGLARDIPAPVKKLVRERCGYGCVICGEFICQYHHNQIEFHEAKQHDPDYIILLCPNCHSQAGHTISHQRIAERDKKPFCKREEHGFIRSFLSPAANINFRFGDSIIKNCPIILAIDGNYVIWTDPPESDAAPFRFSGRFYYEGESFMEIKENELVAITKPGWEIKTRSKQLRIRYANRTVLNMGRSDDDIILKEANLKYPSDYSVTVKPNSRKLLLQSPAMKNIEIGDLRSDGTGIAIHLHQNGMILLERKKAFPKIVVFGNVENY